MSPDRLTLVGDTRPPLPPLPVGGDEEAQPGWGALMDELVAHPFEPRAVFYEGTDAVDGAVYFEWRADRWRTEIELPDDRVVERLIDHGARVTDHDASLPDYYSSHRLSAGRRFSLDLHEATLHYVPHWSVGDAWGVEWEHRVTVVWSSSDHQALVDELVDRLVSEEGIHEREFHLVTDRLGRERLVTAHPSLLNTPSPDALAQAEALERGRTNWRGLPLRRATRRDILRSGEYVRIKGAHYAPVFSSYKDAAIRETSLTLARLGEVRIVVRSGSPRLDVRDRAVRTALADALGRQILLADPELYAADELADRLTRRMEVRSHRLAGRLTIAHEAPFSERGRMWIEGVDPEEAVLVLSELGIVGERSPTTSYRAVYGDRASRRGRVVPPHPDFLAGGRLALPEGTMVLHGLTGVGDDHCGDRVEAIVRSGGLKSIAERRRIGIDVDSMSPMGDIASGIDQGVSATIAKEAHYGYVVTFVMKPTVLARRDLWFSDRDFGGSDDRYEHYSAYARSIGQSRVYVAPDLRARARHLAKGARMADNEVYLKHRVDLEEIDAIAVEGEPAKGVRRLLRGLSAEGLSVPPVVVCRPRWDDRAPQARYPTVAEFVAERHRAWGGRIALDATAPSAR